jgi:hypothetical protein
MELILFYASKDLQFAVGEECILAKYINEKVVQKRNLKSSRVTLTNTKHKFDLMHLYGVSNRSLSDFVKSVGIEMENKKEFDKLKLQMDRALVEYPYLFMSYANDDAVKLNYIK